MESLFPYNFWVSQPWELLHALSFVLSNKHSNLYPSSPNKWCYSCGAYNLWMSNLDVENL